MLVIKRPIFETMLSHVLAVYPEEGCGLLAGKEGYVVWETAVSNILHSPTAYQMEPLEQVQAMLEIERQGWELLAIYHSHPNGPETPSPTDVAQAHYPEAAQVIISLALPWPVVRVFRVVEGQITEIEWQVE